MKRYMFRRVRLPIIRSLFTVHSAIVYVIQALYTQLSSRTRIELQFHSGPARKQSTNLYEYTIAELTVNKLLMMDRGTVRNM
jgi:hypothetical protein